MSKRKAWPNRTVAEIAAALVALEYANAAADDDEEFLRRMNMVPVWLFTENPETRRIATEAVPDSLRVLKDMAAQGNKEAAELLIGVLEANPTLQSSFPDDADEG